MSEMDKLVNELREVLLESKDSYTPEAWEELRTIMNKLVKDLI